MLFLLTGDRLLAQEQNVPEELHILNHILLLTFIDPLMW